VRYPILPRIEPAKAARQGVSRFRRREILHIRHHSLYAPSDFDLSPFFRIVKPTVEEGFNYKGLSWAEERGAESGGHKTNTAPRVRQEPWRIQAR